VRRFGGGKLNQLSAQVGAHGLLAMVVLRLVPVAPFTLVNLVVGASRISLRDCLLGTAIGMLPSIVIAASLVDRIGALVREPGAVTVGLLVLVLMLPATVLLLLRRQRKRKAARAETAGAALAMAAGSAPAEQASVVNHAHANPDRHPALGPRPHAHGPGRPGEPKADAHGQASSTRGQDGAKPCEEETCR
jgi:hypothetical protein